MAQCLMCNCVIGGDIHYRLDNMGIEITNAIELQIGYENQFDSEICQYCFENILENLKHTREVSISHDNLVCIWCQSSLFRKSSHWIPEPLKQIVSNKISPRIIVDGALLCASCWKRVQNIAWAENIKYVKNAPSTNICVRCKYSLSKRRSHPLPDGPERNYIATEIHPREIPGGGRVCWGCWQTAQRHTRSRESEKLSDCIWCASSLNHRQYRWLGKGPERQELQARIFPRQIPVKACVCLNCWTALRHNINMLEGNISDFALPMPTMQFRNYRKTTNSSSRCFVPRCTNSERCRVPTYLKKHIFLNKKIYLCANSRVCEEHRAVDNWDLLDESDFTNVFRQEDIEEIFEWCTYTK